MTEFQSSMIAAVLNGNRPAQPPSQADVLVAQYSGFEPSPGAHLDGRRSLGENLSDLVGVTIALDAYRLHAAANGIDTNAKRDGFSGEQRLFLGWAQLWRTQTTEAALHAEIDSAYHSPARYRVNGVVRNLQAWYDAFGVGDEAKLYVAVGRGRRCGDTGLAILHLAGRHG